MDRKQDLHRIASALLGLGEVFDKQLSETLVDLYVKALDGLTAEQIEQAAGKAITSCKWFPKPVELRELAGGTEQASLEDLAEVQADIAVEAIDRVGPYRSITFEDPVTTAVIRQRFGGWENWCCQPPGEIKWSRKDFVKAYLAYSRSGIQEHGSLVGIAEAKNVFHGIAHKEQPALIAKDGRIAIEAQTKQLQ